MRMIRLPKMWWDDVKLFLAPDFLVLYAMIIGSIAACGWLLWAAQTDHDQLVATSHQWDAECQSKGGVKIYSGDNRFCITSSSFIEVKTVIK